MALQAGANMSQSVTFTITCDRCGAVESVTQEVPSAGRIGGGLFETWWTEITDLAGLTRDICPACKKSQRYRKPEQGA